MQPVSSVPKVVRLYWFGAEMNETRRRSVESIRRAIGSDCVLEIIGERELEKYHAVVPVHGCFQYLSGIHKSDYLRGHIGHHWGGGYTDIKPYNYSWDGCFDVFEDSEVWVAGAPEFSPSGVAGCQDVVDMWKYLLTQCNDIMRSRTPYSLAVLTRQNDLLDRYADALRAHPANCDRCSRASDFDGEFPEAGEYPISWNHLWGAIVHPAQVEFLSHVRQSLPIWDVGAPYR